MEDINGVIKEEILKDFKTFNGIKASEIDTGSNEEIEPKEPSEEKPKQEEPKKDENEPLYKLYVDKAVQSILNLTNRLKFPEPLRYIVLDLMTDFYNVYLAKTNETPESSSKKITSMSEAGRSVSFGDSSEAYYNTLISNHIKEQTEMRRKEIYRYRLLYREVLKKENGQN